MKRRKNGFSMTLFTKSDVEAYTIYFERKDKLTFCYIVDSYAQDTFRGKSVCHKLDEFDETIGKCIAFNEALDKRDLFYERLLKRATKDILDAKNHNVNIEYKANKLFTK